MHTFVLTLGESKRTSLPPILSTIYSESLYLNKENKKNEIILKTYPKLSINDAVNLYILFEFLIVF